MRDLERSASKQQPHLIEKPFCFCYNAIIEKKEALL